MALVGLHKHGTRNNESVVDPFVSRALILDPSFSIIPSVEVVRSLESAIFAGFGDQIEDDERSLDGPME